MTGRTLPLWHDLVRPISHSVLAQSRFGESVQLSQAHWDDGYRAGRHRLSRNYQDNFLPSSPITLPAPSNPLKTKVKEFDHFCRLFCRSAYDESIRPTPINLPDAGCPIHATRHGWESNGPHPSRLQPPSPCST